MTKLEQRVVKAAMDHWTNLRADKRLNWSTEALERKLLQACAALAKQTKKAKP